MTDRAQLGLTGQKGGTVFADSAKWKDLTRTVLMYETKNGRTFTMK